MPKTNTKPNRNKRTNSRLPSRSGNGAVIRGNGPSQSHDGAECPLLTADDSVVIDEACLLDEEDLADSDELSDGPDLELTGMDDQIDDPVRIYLMQMGEIPLLTRKEEIKAAKRIERSRARFRQSMLATDYVLQGAVGLLEKIRDGRLRLDRTVEVSVTNLRQKRHIMGLLGPNLRTLRHLLEANRRDYYIAISRRQLRRKRREAWKRLCLRRHKAVRLIEELNLRTQRLQPLGAQVQLLDQADCLVAP